VPGAILKYPAWTTVCATLLISGANAADCRTYVRDVQKAIKTHVTALQRTEHEASDRLKGLDSRPFDFLLGEAKKAAAIIADPPALEDEKTLERCRPAVRPIRKPCAHAALMLVDILGKHLANEKPDNDRAQYASLVAECEKAMGLKPVQSVIRATG
jgi:hypothetical protein